MKITFSTHTKLNIKMTQNKTRLFTQTKLHVWQVVRQNCVNKTVHLYSRMSPHFSGHSTVYVRLLIRFLQIGIRHKLQCEDAALAPLGKLSAFKYLDDLFFNYWCMILFRLARIIRKVNFRSLRQSRKTHCKIPIFWIIQRFQNLGRYVYI